MRTWLMAIALPFQHYWRRAAEADWSGIAYCSGCCSVGDLCGIERLCPICENRDPF